MKTSIKKSQIFFPKYLVVVFTGIVAVVADDSCCLDNV